jgi:hypothetical protein
MPLCLYFRIGIKLPTLLLVHAIAGKCRWLVAHGCWLFDIVGWQRPQMPTEKP